MAEWHVTPDYILEHWTDELLELMVSKLSERKNRQSRGSAPGHTVADHTLFSMLGNKIKLVKR